MPVTTGPTDASAVPVTPLAIVPGAWEPSIVVDYPVEPSTDDGADDGAPSEPIPALADRFDEHDELAEDLTEHEDEQAELAAHPAADPPAGEAPAPKPAAKRKRASVPSWDEIMFGGPRQD